jgi:hypothetical protein
MVNAGSLCHLALPFVAPSLSVAGDIFDYPLRGYPLSSPPAGELCNGKPL